MHQTMTSTTERNYIQLIALIIAMMVVIFSRLISTSYTDACGCLGHQAGIHSFGKKFMRALCLWIAPMPVRYRRGILARIVFISSLVLSTVLFGMGSLANLDFWAIAILFFPFQLALFACGMMPIGSALVPMEFGKRLDFAAYTTLLGLITVGSIIKGHQKFTFLLSNPGALVRRRPVFLLDATGVIIPQ
jgi:hypothetical protein